MARTTRGISLVELLLTLSACSVILTLSAGLIHRAMHAQSKSRAFADVERNAMRLGNAFRRDIHAADQALSGDETLAEGAVLRLRLAGDETVEYRRAGGVVQRVGLAGDVVQSREEFSFPAEISLTVEQETPRLVVFSITTPVVTASAAPMDKRPPPAYATPVSLRVAAVLARNRPTMSPPAEQEPVP